MTDRAHDLTDVAGSRATTRALWVAFALYVVSAVAVALQRTVLSPENNFAILRSAAMHLASGEDLYAAYPALHADFFKYSPTFALLFRPFALLPVVPAYVAWSLCCASAVFVGITRLLSPRDAVVALLLAWLSVVGDLQRAQSNALVAGLILLAWAAFERNRPWAAATAIATGAFVKIFPLAGLVGAVLHPRRARFAFRFAVALAVGIALPLLVTSPSLLAGQYASWRAIESLDAAPLARYGAGGAGLYAGLMGALRTWFGVEWPHWPVQLGGLALLLAPVAWRRDRWGDPQFRITLVASILVFCVLFNHQSESPSYAIAMIGISVWFAASDRTGWRIALLVFAILVVNLGSTDLMPRAWYRDYYVRYMLKTVPLIPVWIVMQLELLGVVHNRQAMSAIREGDAGDARILERAPDAR